MVSTLTPLSSKPTICFFSLHCRHYFFFFFAQITSPSRLDCLSLYSNPKPPQASISTSSVKHRNSFQSTHKLRPSSQAPRHVPVDPQAPTHNHKFATILSLYWCVLCGCVWFSVAFEVELLCIVMLWWWWLLGGAGLC